MHPPVYPMWSLPPAIAINAPSRSPSPAQSTSSSATTNSSSSLSSLASSSKQHTDGDRLSVRFPVAPPGRYFDAATIRSLYTLPDPSLRFHHADRHHAVHVRSIDGLYIPKDLVRHILRPEPGKRKAVLDLAPYNGHLAGGGAGDWPIDMALEFPDVQVVCIDQHPHPTKSIPPNCRFSQENYRLAMPKHHGKYDIVHARFIGGGVRNYPVVIAEMARCLKPGGIILTMDADLQLLDHNLEPQDMALDDGHNRAPRYSWLARLFFEAYNVRKAQGVPIDAGLMLGSWLKKSEAFENVETQPVHVPIGPWKSSGNPQEHEKLRYMGTLTRENMLDLAANMSAFLVNESGRTYTQGPRTVVSVPRYDPIQVDDWMVLIQQELKTMRVRMHLKFHYAWAIKRHDYIDPPHPGPIVAAYAPQDSDDEEEDDVEYLDEPLAADDDSESSSEADSAYDHHRHFSPAISSPEDDDQHSTEPDEPGEVGDDELSSDEESVGQKRRRRGDDSDHDHSPHRATPPPPGLSQKQLRDRMEALRLMCLSGDSEERRRKQDWIMSIMNSRS